MEDCTGFNVRQNRGAGAPDRDRRNLRRPLAFHSVFAKPVIFRLFLCNLVRSRTTLVQPLLFRAAPYRSLLCRLPYPRPVWWHAARAWGGLRRVVAGRGKGGAREGG
jgi:hypothetical protein